ncbi:hypothetical protein MIND_00459300 [Mycena indigotica]|uniref:Uncharacterized protein n=1 Tax=Mycena indigotica TaxID=2126181 RepID=A0A8H6W6H7_9AGAR|nr:uncharacterized protein MIND_00459300 [Mycena indigotica]KAF7306677.1 hypothetical protein MIND_00459300 [Mycena indigotica]
MQLSPLLRSSLKLSTRVRKYTIVRTPPANAPRECPTPLLFVSAAKWDADSAKGIDSLSTVLTSKGFTCIHSDLSPKTTTECPTALIDGFVHELKSELRLSGYASFFPPVIFGRAGASLIAQAYISSNPVSAMMLMGNIPAKNAEVPKTLLSAPLEEFNFEPKFPISLLTTPQHMQHLLEHNRLARAGVSRYAVDELDGQEALLKIEEWLDKLGI